MKIRLSGIAVTDATGKIGGSVFGKGRAGHTVRNNAMPVKRFTNVQQQAKQQLSTLSQNWKGLTQAQRDSWNAAAPDFPRQIWGNTYTPTGANLYVIMNQGLLLASSAIVTLPTDGAPPAALLTLTLGTITTALLPIVFTPTPIGATEKIVIQATRPLSPGKTSIANEFRDLLVTAVSDTSPHAAGAAYIAKFGAPVVGKKIFIRAYVISTTSGIRSLPLQASGIGT